MDLPAWVPFPSLSLRREIVPQEWEACLDAWISLAQAYLLVPTNQFRLIFSKDDSLVPFLSSYFQEMSRDPHVVPKSVMSRTLHQECFLLAHRLLSELDAVPPSIDWTVLGNLSTVYAKRRVLRALMDTTSLRKELEPGLQKLKRSLVIDLEKSGSEGSENLNDSLRRLCALIYASPNIGHFFMIGSDFMDALISAHTRASTGLGKKLVTIAYLGLVSLTEGDKPNISLLIDHLYSLKNSTEAESKATKLQSSLVSALVTDTPLLRKLEDRVKGADAPRLKPVLSALKPLRNPSGSNKKRLVRRKIDKGKARDHDEYGHGSFNGIHVHRMSLVTQLQDLFPDLGSAFIIKLLDEYSDNVEQVTAHLLEDSLPPHLREADRTEQIPHINTHTTTTAANPTPHLAPRSTPPVSPNPQPQPRHNIFDHDPTPDLALLPPTSNLHHGRRSNPTLTADTLLSHRPTTHPNHKAAILSALAAFDSDDDERDDTYDVADVGGTVEASADADIDAPLRRPRDAEGDEDGNVNEEALFTAYKISPDVFNRDSATRRGRPRAALKGQTGMTDEAIEGWSIMLARDGRKMRRLEAKFSSAPGRAGQRELVGTAWRGGGGAGSGTEDSDGGGGGVGRGGRGLGRGIGRGGNVAGPADDKGTQVARQRKDANKGSRANHNRRDQRARKMARGGFAG